MKKRNPAEHLKRFRFVNGHLPHNKGKTKDTYEPLKTVGQKSSKALKEYYKNNPHDDEYKKKMSISCKGINKGVRPQLHIDKMTGIKHNMSESWRKKKSDYMLTNNNPMKNRLSRKKLSETKIQLFKDYPKKHLNHILKEKGHKTQIESLMERALINEGIKILPQERLEGFWVDIFIPNFNIVIECDGEYWHNYPEGTERDRYKTEKLENVGYLVLRFWEREIHENVEECVASVIDAIDRLEKFKRNIIEVDDKMKEEKIKMRSGVELR